MVAYTSIVKATAAHFFFTIFLRTSAHDNYYVLCYTPPADEAV